jgi:hypothetical protein
MSYLYKFPYTIKQIIKYSWYQVSRLSRQFDKKFYAIELNKQENSFNSGEPQQVERNSHGFPTDLK